jgi:outer membrane protein assembly factor BamB
MSKTYSPIFAAALLSLSAAASGLPAAAAPAPAAAPAAAPVNEWITWGYDQERSGWNRAETTLSKDNVANLKVLWNTKLSTPINPVALSTLTAPVVVTGVQTRQGRKNLMFILGADDTLFALDADTGAQVWKKSFPNPLKPAKIATWLCSNTANATPTIDKARGIVYFVASDGILRGHNLADGAERLTPVEMTAPWARAWSLNLIDNIVYTTTGRACGEVRDPRSVMAAASIPLRRGPNATGPAVQTDPSSAVAVDVLDLKKPEVTRYFTSGARPSGAWGRGGPVRGPGNSIIFMTSDGLFDPGSGNWGDSVLKLSPKVARMQDSFTPENHRYIMSKDLAGSGSPVVFDFAGKTLIAAAQKEGVLYILDANDMGGGKDGKHEKYLFKSSQLGNDAAAGTDPGMGVWGATSTYLSPDGRRFIYVPMWGPHSKDAPTFPVVGGPSPNGSIMAFEVVAQGDKIVAVPAWTSGDMVMPDPPSVANGVVFATSTGGQALQNRTAEGVRFPSNTSPESIRARSTPVSNLTLYAFDAVTGKQLYSSEKAITDWVHFGEPVIAMGKVFLVTHDAQVYAFGLGR